MNNRPSTGFIQRVSSHPPRVTTPGALRNAISARTLLLTAAIAATALLTASCSSSSSPRTQPTPTVTATATPSLAPGPAAIAVYREFTRRELIAWHRRTTAGLNLASYAAPGTPLTNVDAEITSLLQNKQTLSGQPTLSPTVMSATDLIVHLTDCVDNSQITVVDDAGKNVKTGPTRIPTKVTVQRIAAEEPWLITKITSDFTGTKC